MLKNEFEAMIGKQVAWNTFRMYEDMYSACPENITKQQFVAMLNIEAIPESPEAIARREENERLIQDIKTQIAAKRSEIRWFEQENVRYRTYIKESEDTSDIKSYKRYIRANNEYMNKLRSEIRELKWIID